MTPALRNEPLTFYARWGDVPAYGLLAIVTVVFAWRTRRPR